MIIIINQKVIRDIIALLAILRIELEATLRELCTLEITLFLDREHVELAGDPELEEKYWARVKWIEKKRDYLMWLITQTRVVCYVASA